MGERAFSVLVEGETRSVRSDNFLYLKASEDTVDVEFVPSDDMNGASRRKIGTIQKHKRVAGSTQRVYYRWSIVGNEDRTYVSRFDAAVAILKQTSK